MSYATISITHAQASLLIIRAGAPDPAGSKPDEAAVTARSPDPRSALNVSSAAADAIFALVNMKNGAKASAPATAGADAFQAGTTVHVAVETVTETVTVRRPVRELSTGWWDFEQDARRFLDAAYRQLGESADTPRSFDDWYYKVGLDRLNQGALWAITHDTTSSESELFTDAEKDAARKALKVWDRSGWLDSGGMLMGESWKERQPGVAWINETSTRSRSVRYLLFDKPEGGLIEASRIG
jgi:hypothetical protein